MKPIIHKVSETTTHTHTKRFKSFLTDEQVMFSNFHSSPLLVKLLFF
jgi:hypothetical protein